MTPERRPCLALLLALLLVAAPAGADTGTELLFAPGQLADIAEGTVLAYSHRRVAPDAGLDDGRVTLTVNAIEGRRAAILELDGNGRSRRLDPFPAGPEAGNPVLLAFLETVTRRIAAATGGSPFYLRNRMREALARGGTLSATGDGAQRIRYEPFAGDRNADRLGGFAGLVLSFTLSEETPGRLLALRAETPGEPPLYFEEISLIGPAR